MKICFITRFYKPYVRGGAEIYVGEIAEKLVDEGNDVVVITPSPERRAFVDEVNGVTVYRISPFNIATAYESHERPLYQKIIYHLLDLFNLDSYIKIKRILKKENPDIVHIHNYKGLSTSAFKAVSDSRIPIVFTVHDYSPLCIKTNLLNSKGEICRNQRSICKFYKALQRAFIDTKPDIVTAPSKFVIHELKSRGFFENTKIMLLRNAVKLKAHKVDKKYDVLKLLYVGAISQHKGVHTLIEASRRVEGNVQLHIVGEGPIKKELEILAEGDSRIKFHGFLRGEELENMYRMANLTVLPSIWYDNSPMVIYESFSNSTPVLASRIGGIPELVIDGYNGLLFEPGDVEGLSSLIEKISRDPSILAELERGAYDSCKSYDIDEVIKRLEDIYRELKGSLDI